MTRQDLLKQLAREAGAIIKSANPSRGAVSKQGVGNWVTSTDLQCEKLIIDSIRAHFPNDGILSEETNAALIDPETKDFLWVIDPLDGTNNFRYGRSYSAVSIGLCHQGQSIAGAVYNPFVEEFFYAELGRGAFCNALKLSVGENRSAAGATLGIDDAYEPGGTKKNVMRVLQIEPTPWLMLRGSAALGMCDVAAGRLDLYFQQYIKPWDKAAAVLIVREAGGVVYNFSGTDSSVFEAPTICGNRAIVLDFLNRTK